MKDMLRDADVMVRFGGDEFVILLNSHVIKNVKQRIEQLRQSIEYYFNKKDTQLSFSYGIASLQDGVELALKRADTAMYKRSH